MLAGAVTLNAGEILHRPVLGNKFVSNNEAIQDFVASHLFRSCLTAEVLHVQFATPIVKCGPAWKLRKINVARMFNHKRSHPRALAAEHHDPFIRNILPLLSRYCGLYWGYIVIIIMILLCLFVSYCHYHHYIVASIWAILSLSSSYYWCPAEKPSDTIV